MEPVSHMQGKCPTYFLSGPQCFLILSVLCYTTQKLASGGQLKKSHLSGVGVLHHGETVEGFILPFIRLLCWVWMETTFPERLPLNGSQISWKLSFFLNPTLL